VVFDAFKFVNLAKKIKEGILLLIHHKLIEFLIDIVKNKTSKFIFEANMANCGKSGCSQQLSDESKIYKCSGFCKGSFHSSCAGITRNVESVLNSSKNFKWFCNSCLEIYDNVFDKLNLIQNEIIDEIRLIRKQQETLIKNQIDSLRKRFMDELTFQAEIIESAKSEILNKKEDLKISYADTLKNNEAVMIVKPKNKKQKNEKTKSDLKNIINPNDTPINGLIDSKDGSVILKCKKKSDVNKIKEMVESSLSENYEANIPVSKNPRVKIIGLNEKPTNNEEIIKTLITQNEEFFEDSCDLKVITVMEMKNKKGKNYFNLVIELNPKIYKKIMAIEDVKINFDFNRCKVFDALYVRRCLKCCSIDGHTAKDCEKEMVCYQCSGNHKKAACRNESSKCINCDNANKKFNLKLNIAHNALDRNCPVYQRELKRRARTINYLE
jgi:hypothetical protein